MNRFLHSCKRQWIKFNEKIEERGFACRMAAIQFNFLFIVACCSHVAVGIVNSALHKGSHLWDFVDIFFGFIGAFLFCLETQILFKTSLGVTLMERWHWVPAYFCTITVFAMRILRFVHYSSEKGEIFHTCTLKYTLYMPEVLVSEICSSLQESTTTVSVLVSVTLASLLLSYGVFINTWINEEKRGRSEQQEPVRVILLPQ